MICGNLTKEKRKEFYELNLKYVEKCLQRVFFLNEVHQLVQYHTLMLILILVVLGGADVECPSEVIICSRNLPGCSKRVSHLGTANRRGSLSEELR